MSRIVVVGDVLLDADVDGRADRMCPDAPAPVVSGMSRRTRPGGAGLAAALLAGDGNQVTVICALGRGEAARTVEGLLRGRGVEIIDLAEGGETATKTRVRVGGQVILRLDSDGTAPTIRSPDGAVAAALVAADGVLVSDYGRGMSASPGVRDVLAGVDAPVVWDPHPRGAPPIPGLRLLTPNADEARWMSGGHGTAADHAVALRRETGAAAVAVTVGARGALLAEGSGPPLTIPARPCEARDVCGAGDRLAASAVAALAAGRSCVDAITFAVEAASAMIAAGGAGAALDRPEPAPGGGAARVRDVRVRGGVVVATGGCFDLLHAGHVAMLEAARALGDCLVVLMNSDASVRRLKGPDRPLVHEDDRARVLRGLRCVDEVVVFDEDTPAAALARLAPVVFAKGADYALDELPEAETVRAGGGEVVLLPYTAGRSTTRLIEEVARRAGR